MFTVVFIAFSQKNIGSQAWTFKDYSLEETLEKISALGLKKIEMFPKQRFSRVDSTLTSYKMPKSQLVKLKALLKKYKVKVVSYGVISLKKEKDWIHLFEFAKDMKIKTIITEPAQDQIATIDKLCKQYKIYASIHNHAKPKRHWWNPANVKQGLIGRSKYLGVCADVGHWKRSNLDVTASLKLLKGKITELHIKDVNKPSSKGKPVPLGTGIINWENVFNELNRQKFKGNYIIEHTAKKSVLIKELQHNIAFLKTYIK
ncbi:hypothetical protein GCM10022291_26600 [Postechiella marina]|uniref:Xylose isomerase-like TIM barrel domain-containing protein n=1 Tax=Postechiella marina TaxID=943941 RepID=A0ABP8CDT1_9FLAO